MRYWLSRQIDNIVQIWYNLIMKNEEEEKEEEERGEEDQEEEPH